MAQSLDLVLYQQFTTFKFHYSQVIDRGMGQAFVKFVLKRLMPFFQFRKVRLHRHAVCLLNQWISDDLSVTQTQRKSDDTPAIAPQQTPGKPLIAFDFSKA